MGRSSLTLAALATSASPGLEVVGTMPLGSNRPGAFDSALIQAADGRYFAVRVPTNQQAESEQSADLVALRAMTPGIRNRLPFAVARFVGQVPVGPTRAVLTEFVPGAPLRLASLQAGSTLAESIGQAIAAIHELPTGFAADAGLTVRGAGDSLRSAMAVMDRATETGLVPAALAARWEAAVQDQTLWQFAGTIVNGGFAAESVLVDGDQVSGILGWQGLGVGDPARDLAWVMPASAAVSETVVDAYLRARGSSDAGLVQRARLHSELELAQWLLHGQQQRSTEIVDDAVGLMHALVDTVAGDLDRTVTHETAPVMTVDEVDAMLRARGA